MQEFKVQLQKVKQAHHRRENLLEQTSKYWQARDANSNKADGGKRRQTVKLAAPSIPPLERLLHGPLHQATHSWNKPPLIQAHILLCPKQQSHTPSILIPSRYKVSKKDTTKREW